MSLFRHCGPSLYPPFGLYLPLMLSDVTQASNLFSSVSFK